MAKGEKLFTPSMGKKGGRDRSERKNHLQSSQEFSARALLPYDYLDPGH
jgi:hypothetical protein